MDKYYEKFHDKNEANKKDFFNSPDCPDPWHQHSDADGWTRLKKSWGLSEEEWVVCEKENSLSFIKMTQSLIY